MANSITAHWLPVIPWKEQARHLSCFTYFTLSFQRDWVFFDEVLTLGSLGSYIYIYVRDMTYACSEGGRFVRGTTTWENEFYGILNGIIYCIAYTSGITYTFCNKETGNKTQVFYTSVDNSYKEYHSFLFPLAFTERPQPALSVLCLFSLGLFYCWLYSASFFSFYSLS